MVFCKNTICNNFTNTNLNTFKPVDIFYNDLVFNTKEFPVLSSSNIFSTIGPINPFNTILIYCFDSNCNKFNATNISGIGTFAIDMLEDKPILLSTNFSQNNLKLLIYRSNTSAPTLSPTLFPTKPPTQFPTKSPSLSPTLFPSSSPTPLPTNSPTNNTLPPTKSPTIFKGLRPGEIVAIAVSIPVGIFVLCLGICLCGLMLWCWYRYVNRPQRWYIILGKEIKEVIEKNQLFDGRK